MRRRTRIVAATATALGALLATATIPDGAAAAHASAAPAPVVAGGDYLALGDSVSFGYREPTTDPAPDYKDAASFVGYPELVGAALGLTVENLACPGETSTSLIDPKAPSNGCESTPNAAGTSIPVGYRTAFPLHAAYSGSQLAAGVAYLKAHPRTTLVTLMIGANDFFLCEATTKDACHGPAEATKVLATVGTNVAAVLRALKGEGYTGQIVVVGYYSTDYADALDNELSQALDAAMRQAGKPFGAEYANGYAAFAAAARYSGDDPCRAGLLTQLYAKAKATGICGIHPSPAGAAVLAQAVESAVAK